MDEEPDVVNDEDPACDETALELEGAVDVAEDEPGAELDNVPGADPVWEPALLGL